MRQAMEIARRAFLDALNDWASGPCGCAQCAPGPEEFGLTDDDVADIREAFHAEGGYPKNLPV